jgi:hypothetical protein
MSWLDDLLSQTEIQVGGTAATIRPTLNFVAGSNTTISASDDPVRLRTDITVATTVDGTYTTIETAIASAATWTGTASGHSCTVSKTTYVEADFLVKRASGVSAYFKRTVAVQYVSGAYSFVANSGTTVAGNTIAEELDASGFDVQFKLTAGVLTFEAKAPTAGSFSVTYRTLEL